MAKIEVWICDDCGRSAYPDPGATPFQGWGMVSFGYVGVLTEWLCCPTCIKRGPPKSPPLPVGTPIVTKRSRTPAEIIGVETETTYRVLTYNGFELVYPASAVEVIDSDTYARFKADAEKNP